MYANVFTCPRTLSDFTVEICGYISGLPGRPRYTSYKTIKRQTCRLRVGITRPYLQFQRCQFLPDVFRFGLDDPEEKGKGTRSSSSLAHSYSSSLLRWPSQFIVAHINASNKKLQHIYLLLTLFFTQRKRRILRNVWNSFVLLGSTVVVPDLTQTIFNLGGGVYTRGQGQDNDFLIYFGRLVDGFFFSLDYISLEISLVLNTFRDSFSTTLFCNKALCGCFHRSLIYCLILSAFNLDFLYRKIDVRIDVSLVHVLLYVSRFNLTV